LIFSGELKFKVLAGKVAIFGRTFTKEEKVHTVNAQEKGYEI
jgi:hypothetical protein